MINDKKIVTHVELIHPRMIITSQKLPKQILSDSHCHLFNLWEKVDKDYERLTEIISQSKDSGITHLVSSALSPEEYRWQSDCDFSSVISAMGIHPIYKEKDRDFEFLTQLVADKKVAAIGEIGLDKNGGPLQAQEALLLEQLDLARTYDLPVIFHVVKRYNELYKLLKNNFPKVRGYLHSFNSSKTVAEHFSQFDLAFSISARMPNEKTLRYIIKRGFMLLETDAPFALASDIEADFNKPSFLINNLESIIKKSAIEKEIIIDAQERSFRDIFINEIEKNEV